ncbi:protein translocase subunit secE/sec61 gamma [Rubrobacter xylanophilus DSM 9941]|uniref:Protein translocase subunit SecE n=1 Tax=Rubrobacter xylanophilus (strain DSM 9941 / JCM 11954 / NBRC 16129 / PRD-1) TaxID=266117 RepID=Q1AU16_RUBXD|nr:preprotein translocase subunit SecE [Rubrobacter xylanophilus]ABG05112.1 protein translocase subunit secE/sec61 gamma [Rubrobacter xylanophilus DSM 9941]
MAKRQVSTATRGAGKKSGRKAQRQGRLAGAKRFVREVRAELGRVTWPDREQLQQSTAVVLIIVLLLTAYIAAWDFVFQSLARLIFL